jgi:molybdopterin-guanine dinucleotide biosynthesis protein A
MGQWSGDDVADTTLAILAGGAGSRMGMPKGLLRVAGKPILTYLLDRLAWPGDTLLVTAIGREHPPGWQGCSREVQDPPGAAGPLRGILTGLENCATGRLVVLTIDMPTITTEQLGWLLRSFGPEMLGLMLRRSTSGIAQIEPFPSVFHMAARQVLAQRLKEGPRSVHGLLSDGRFTALDAPHTWPAEVWTNLNYPSDLIAPH